MGDISRDKPAPIERDAETLELFIEESLEALTRLEAALLVAERGAPPPGMLGALFRDIHTIKGTSGFLALRYVLGLSHAAEDLLSRLRDGGLSARGDHFVCLVGCVDKLRRLIENVRDTGDEGEVDVGPQLAQLKVLLDEPDGPAPALAPPPPVPRAQARAAAPVVAAPVPAAPMTVMDAAVSTASSAPVEPDPSGQVADAPPADGSVRVSVGVLDRLMNLVGELVLARNQMLQIVKVNRDGSVNGQAACQRLSLVTSDLQEQIMKTRMQPVARVFERIPRMVRDLCQSTGKRVASHIDGNATEIDKALVETIRDPVMHIVRNAIDHGIEAPAVREARGKPATGQLSIRAAHDGGVVLIEIEDDGAGMDPHQLRAHAIKKGVLSPSEAGRLSDREALELVFRPGFSTAQAVTDISGRGVGMDVVRTHVERAGGQVELESVVGKGTTIRLKMPLTLAIIPALLARSRGQRFAIPQVNLLELVYLNEEQAQTAIEFVRSAPIYRLRGELLPLVHLHAVLGLPPSPPADNGVSIVVVAIGSSRYGLIVDEIHDIEEIVIKPLHGQLKRISCYSGATVLGDGGVALILDMAGLGAMAGLDTSSRRRAPVDQPLVSGQPLPQPHIVFIAGDGAQCAVPLAMVARLEQINRSTIERVAGLEVVQYRSLIMPVIRPEAVLPIGQPPTGREDQQLILFDFGQQVGMAVSDIIDVVEVASDNGDGQHDVPYTLGQTVIFGKTTMLIDVYAIVRKLVPEFTRERTPVNQRSPRILVADDSRAMRAAISGYLRSSGLEVVEAANGEAAIKELRACKAGSFDAVVTDLEMPEVDGFGVIEMVRKERPATPVIMWTYRDDPEIAARARAAGARACINKLQREELVAALDATGLVRRSSSQNARSVTP